MADRRKPATDPREESIDDLEWVRLTLTTIAGRYGDVIVRQSENAYAILDGVLQDGSAPVDWLQGGAAFWVEGLRAGAGLLRGIVSTVSRPFGPLSLQSGPYGDKIEFYVDDSTEVTDPVATKIPRKEIDTVNIATSDGIPRRCVNLTVGDRDIVYVALQELRKAKLRPNKKGHNVVLSWGPPRSRSNLTFSVFVK
jgi:hypothetical protein